MTILHVLDHSMPVPSGYSSRSRYIIETQRRLGLRPVVVTSPKHGGTRSGVEVIDGIRHYRTGSLNGPPLVHEVRLMARMAARIATIARAERARILHAHSPLLNGLAALWAGRWLGLPVVYEARAFWEDAAVDHGTTREGSLRYHVTRQLETVVFRHADRVVTICEGMRREVIGRGIDARRVRVVGNGVDTERFRPMTKNTRLARQLGLDGGCTIGFVGSFYRYEGLRFLLESFRLLQRRVPAARLLLVGSGEEEQQLRALASTFGPAVVFTGQIPHEQIGEFFSVIDVFVCPRLRMRLTELVTPLKPLEAMAMACPVLASDVGGLAELIEHDVTGLLFRADCREALVEEGVRVARQPELRRRLGERARSHVIGERTWGRVVREYLPLYEEIS